MADSIPKMMAMPKSARPMPTTSSLRSADSRSQNESARGDGCDGDVRCMPFDADLACDGSPFLGGKVLPTGFVLFLGGVDDLRRGMSNWFLAFD